MLSSLRLVDGVLSLWGFGEKAEMSHFPPTPVIFSNWKDLLELPYLIHLEVFKQSV